ncbi:MAG: hypothetical protein ACLTEE_16630 [Anaerobutyricum hallii]
MDLIQEAVVINFRVSKECLWRKYENQRKENDELHKEQEQAIFLRDKNIMVSAGAEYRKCRQGSL